MYILRRVGRNYCLGTHKINTYEMEKNIIFEQAGMFYVRVKPYCCNIQHRILLTFANEKAAIDWVEMRGKRIKH